MSQLPKVIPQESPTDNPTMSILNTDHDGTLPVVTIIPTDQHVPSVDKNISPSNDGGANNTHKVLSRQPSHKRKENISLNNNSKRVKKNNTKTKDKSTANNELLDQESDIEVVDLLDVSKSKPKVKEKRKSAVSHFNYYLSIKNKKLERDGISVTVKTFEDLTFEDVHTGAYIGEFANYLANNAKSRINQKKKDGNLKKGGTKFIAYQTATGYMGAIKNLLIDKFKNKAKIPHNLSNEIWTRYMAQVRSQKWTYCRQERTDLQGTKDTATDKDRVALFAICIWSGNVQNAEFLNFFKVWL